ncbi:TRAP transporter substrate-binding protein DctP [Denitromonas sp.]|uniref:TRAP transporter substrate-binding protein DctP n=1 Tax=Denitromonas sp. TaxID=2734609 RepID=UPI003A8AB202
MMMQKKLAALLLGAGLVFGATAVTAANLKISHVRPQGAQVDKDLRVFAEQVTQATGGKLKFDLFPANALGDYTVVQERISVGAVDMALQPVATGVNKRLQIGALPYLATDWPSAKRVFGKGSPLRAAMEDLYAKQDITVLAAYPVYFGGISLNKPPVSPGDPDAKKGLKLRVPPIKSFQLLADSIGYIGSPLPFSEAFTAVQTGVVDGVIGSGAEGYYASFRDVTKYYLPMNTHFEVWYLLINGEVLNDMDKADRAKLEEAAATFENSRWAAAEADQSGNEKKLQDAGAQLVPVSAEALAANARNARAQVWPEIIKDMGEAWARPIVDSVTK